MAYILSGQNVCKSFGGRPLFTDITIGISDGERLGLLGPNGAGKSTLLRILAGLETVDSGNVSARRSLRLAYLAQDPVFPEGLSVEDVLNEALLEQPLDEIERSVRVSSMISRVRFPDSTQAAAKLSGGWRKRLAIARELIREPDLLLMDEPTNHLDLEGIRWLEELLKTAPFAFVMVSHDRYFLENVTNRVVELNRAYPEGYFSSSGNYSDFLTHREEFLQGQLHHQEALESRARREVDWLRSNAQARSTKQQARIRDAGKLLDNLAEVRFRNSQNKSANVQFNASGRKTRDLITTKGLCKSLGGRPLFKDVDLSLSPRTRLGLLGANGSGKTTLLRVLAGEIEPDAGEIRRAEGLRVVYFDQNRQQLERSTPLKEALSPTGDTVIYRGASVHVVAWAKRFLFRTEQLELPVGLLSGGEQARVLMAQMMLQPADLLILDEPTNDLDIPTLEVLEESLNDFAGALVLVTHDRYLLDRVTTEVLALDAKGGNYLLADYRQWEDLEDRMEAQAQQPAARAAAAKAAAAKAASAPAVALTTAERRELGDMDAKIEAAEAEVERLQQRMSDPGVVADHVKLQECWDQVLAAQAKSAALYARWEELEAKKAQSGR